MSRNALNTRAAPVTEVIARLTVPTVLRPDVQLLAVRCGLELEPTDGGRAMLRAGRVYYDARQQPDDKDREIARCVARYALRCCEVPATRTNVQEVTEAILNWSGVKP